MEQVELDKINRKKILLTKWWDLYASSDLIDSEKNEFESYFDRYINDLYDLILVHFEDGICPKSLIQMSRSGRLVIELHNIHNIVSESLKSLMFSEIYKQMDKKFEHTINSEYKVKKLK